MRFSELESSAILLWGAGVEIRALVDEIEAREIGTEIRGCVFDAPPPGDTLDWLRRHGIRALQPGEVLSAAGGAAALIRSPGVSIHRPDIQAIKELGLAVTTPTGLWLAERRGRRVIGVTGTKGKSTTATLIAKLLESEGVQVALAGNIGVPAIGLLDLPEDRIVVLELSSYQTADLEYGSETALVANLYLEHLDWHLSHENYRREKLRLLTLPGVETAVHDAREETVREAAIAAGRPRVEFGGPDGWHADSEAVYHGDERRAEAADLPLRGLHNLNNLCAALAAIEAAGLPTPDDLVAALEGFETLPHRLSTVAEVGGITWVDDSISTTAESAIAAVESFPGRPIVLIGGGQDRGQDYGALGALLASRGAGVIGLPDTGTRLVDTALSAGGDPSRARSVQTMVEAVAAARTLTEPGAVVLLSPAAPSYNAYTSFKERGDEFARLALESATPTSGTG